MTRLPPATRRSRLARRRRAEVAADERLGRSLGDKAVAPITKVVLSRLLKNPRFAGVFEAGSKRLTHRQDEGAGGLVSPVWPRRIHLATMAPPPRGPLAKAPGATPQAR